MKSCLWKILPSLYSSRNLWLNVYTFRQNLALNNLQRLIRHKIQSTNQNLNTLDNSKMKGILITDREKKFQKIKNHSGQNILLNCFAYK